MVLTPITSTLQVLPTAVINSSVQLEPIKTSKPTVCLILYNIITNIDYNNVW